ncbi:MAG: RagB/SusD family nutrient uptake outer membrane protein [Chitinophagaceae bacterium]|nr:MAG: RagB/SusD family nutrient uptake outer membrane protein [Chitinophagaceae bacterium]
MKSFYSSFAILFTSFLFISCEKFLDVEPKELTSDQITITDENSARTAVRGLYNQLGSNGYYGYTFQTLGFFSGDNIQYVGSQTVNQQLTNHDVKSDLGAVSTAWTAIYKTINRANNVLSKVPGIALTSTFTETAKNQLLGEAHFVRALAYFDLARTWGGVQIVLEPTASATGRDNVKRSTLAETYAQVLADLTKAESLLPETVNRIRATKSTVWALRARYHLYQQQWAEAETYATKIISDKANYQLHSPWSSFFANNAQATSESVLELFYTTTVTNNQASQWQPSTKGGVGWIKPTNALVALLNDPEIGGARNALIQRVLINGVENWFGNLYYRTNGTDPAFLIRVAELYLIRAEARAQLNNVSGAIEDVTAIRESAGITQPVADNISKTDLLLVIENENRLEFALENHRWYDLVRTNRAATVLGIADPNKLLLPVPFSETIVDKQLEQNPGYGQ